MSPTPQPYLASITPYIGGKSAIAGQESIIKLSSNENPNGASPKAIQAYQAAAAKLHRYPEDGAHTLRAALAAHHGFAPEQLICGAGSDDVLRMLCAAYGGAHRSVVYTEHGFAMYRIYAQQSGATSIAAPETNLRVDVDKLLASVREDTSLVFIANPNNPTGSYLSKDKIHRLREGLREDVILVLDGAYAEYMHAEDYSDGSELSKSSNTVITRTFSKAYGLSGLRVGWGAGPQEIIDALYKVRSPFNITQPSLEAALAALADQSYLQQHIAENNTQRARLEAMISALGITIHPCFANFILLQFADENACNAANAHLQSKGIIVRAIANYGLPDYLRISVGTPAENDALMRALKELGA